MLNKEIFIKRNTAPTPPLRWMYNDCLTRPYFTTAVGDKTYSRSVSLFSTPQTPGCVGQIHGRHQKLYLQNVSRLKRSSTPLMDPPHPNFQNPSFPFGLFSVCTPTPSPPPVDALSLPFLLCSLCFQFISDDILPPPPPPLFALLVSVNLVCK